MNNNTSFTLLIIASILLVILACQPEISQEHTLTTFSSPAELKEYIEHNQEQNPYGYRGLLKTTFLDGVFMESAQLSSPSSQTATDFSTTNIQVQGVDEADFVKNDGTYIYIVKGKTLSIIDAFPADDAQIISMTTLPGRAQNMYVNGDRLIVFIALDRPYEVKNDNGDSITGKMVADMGWYPSYNQQLGIYTYDITNKNDPTLSRELAFDGTYAHSRMVGNYVYTLVNQPINLGIDDMLPYVYEKENGKVISSRIDSLSPLYYFDAHAYNYKFTTLVAMNVVQPEEFTTKAYMLGDASEIFMSTENLYITYTKTASYRGLMNEVMKEILPEDVYSTFSKGGLTAIEEWVNSLSEEEKKDIENTFGTLDERIEKRMRNEQEKTIIHKITIDENSIEYGGESAVPGHILNQFSMDEWNDHFRIATTVGDVWSTDAKSTNNVYIIDSTMNIVGAVEDLAPGEKIYSVRFMGKRGYVVTFKKVDPLFVLDLATHDNPSVLGKLKIPGYSDYLHPYDENHIIGIGKDTVEASESEINNRNLNFAWYQGVKMALFDVSDPTNPIEKGKVIIGDRGTESPVLQDHKAFLFDKEKNLLVLPVTIAEIQGEKSYDNQYGTTVFSGALVYSFDDKLNFVEQGRVSHIDDEQEYLKSGYYFYSDSGIQRSLYTDDMLYTISNAKVKAHNLNNLEEISVITLPNSDGYRDDLYY